jgi:hypothetical protein
MGVEPKPSISESLLRVYGDDAHWPRPVLLAGNAHGWLRQHSHQLGRESLARSPVLQSNDAAIARINFSQPDLDFFSDDRGRVVSLEPKPRDIGLPVVVALDLHRVEALGGHFDLESLPGQGTRLRAVFATTG